MKCIMTFLLLVVGISGYSQEVVDTTKIRDEWIQKDRTSTPRHKIIVKQYHDDDPVVIEYIDGSLCDFAFGAYNGNWSGISFGLIRGNGMPDAYDFIWGGSFVINLNVFEYNIELDRRGNMGLTTGLGLEYQRFRFSDDHTSIAKDENGVVKGYNLPNDLDVRRSTYKNLCLSIPLLYGINFDRWNVSVGGIAGIRLLSKTKVVFDKNDNKEKLKSGGKFNMTPVKLDLTGRVGYDGVYVFVNYTATRVFKKNQGPNLSPLTLGLGFAL